MLFTISIRQFNIDILQITTLHDRYKIQEKCFMILNYLLNKLIMDGSVFLL